MSSQQGELEKSHQRFAEAVRKYLAGEKLTCTEERMIAYGYTAATCGQKLSSGPPELFITTNKQ